MDSLLNQVDIECSLNRMYTLIELHWHQSAHRCNSDIYEVNQTNCSNKELRQTRSSDCYCITAEHIVKTIYSTCECSSSGFFSFHDYESYGPTMSDHYLQPNHTSLSFCNHAAYPQHSPLFVPSSVCTQDSQLVKFQNSWHILTSAVTSALYCIISAQLINCLAYKELLLPLIGFV